MISLVLFFRKPGVTHFHSLSLGNKSKDELERAVEGEKNRREREGEKQEENNTTSSS
jgi:hypothetical protein